MIIFCSNPRSYIIPATTSRYSIPATMLPETMRRRCCATGPIDVRLANGTDNQIQNSHSPLRLLFLVLCCQLLGGDLACWWGLLEASCSQPARQRSRISPGAAANRRVWRGGGSGRGRDDGSRHRDDGQDRPGRQGCRTLGVTRGVFTFSGEISVAIVTPRTRRRPLRLRSHTSHTRLVCCPSVSLT